jgi:hypothetical protein
MGNEAVCAVELDGVRDRAKVLLETDELIVRSPFRVKVPFTSVEHVETRDGQLSLRWDAHVLKVEIGAAAEKWAEKIRSPKPLTAKLGIKAGQRVSIDGTVDQMFIDQLHGCGAEVSRRVASDSDIIFVAVEHRRELGRISAVKAALSPDGALWVIRPKASDAISESDVMAAGKAAGLVDVKVARFSPTHTAEKFVIPVKHRPARRNRG